MTIILAILLLLFLITVHEFGHFTAARMTGIPVHEFAIGMGPKLLSWKSRKYDTLFSIRIFPLGGYCAFVGEDDAKGEHEKNPDAYNHQSVWKRLFSVIMGPVMNFILAFAVAIVFFATTQVSDLIPNSVSLQSVDSGGAAEAAGLMAGDTVTHVNGVAINLNDTASLITVLNEQATLSPTVSFTVIRGDETLTLSVTPVLKEGENPYKIGVTIGPKYTEPYHLPLNRVIPHAWDSCVEAATLIVRSVQTLVTTPDGLSQASGPVGVVASISEQTRTYGALAYINLLVFISINLGIMNLLPIPGLDGSRILFMLLEVVRGKPVSPRKESIVHLVGYVFLFGLLILLTYKDIVRLIA